MPILNTKVKDILREAGLDTSKPGGANPNITDLLNASGLGLEDTLRSMANLRDTADSETTALRVNQDVLKMHGVLKEQPNIAPPVTIIIKDSFAQAGEARAGINPIILPRTLDQETIN